MSDFNQGPTAITSQIGDVATF